MEKNEKAKQFLNYFYNISEDRENVYLRIRGTKEKPEIKVYYKGIKLCDYFNGKIILNVSLILPNNSNALDLMELACQNKIELIKPYKQVKKDYEELGNIGFKLEYANKKIILPLSKGSNSSKLSEKNIEKIKEKLNNIIQTNDYELNKTGYSAQIIDLNDLDLDKVFKLKILCYTQTGYKVKKENGVYINDEKEETGFQSLKVNFRFKEINFDYSAKSFDTLMDIMKRRAEIYAGLAKTYENDFSKTRSDSEKSFQQTLVSKMSTKMGRKQMSKATNTPFSENDIPFEMEYTFYASNKNLKKETIKNIDEENNENEIEDEAIRSRGNKKGRIDNIFIDFENKKVKFIELKIDDGVIGGTNGIHKHLLDMANSLEKNTKFKKEFAEIVKERYEILTSFGIKEEYDINISNLFEKLENGFNLSYDIICGYSILDKKDAVKNRFNSIKDLNILSKNVFNAVSEENQKGSNYYNFKKKLTRTDENNSSNTYIQKFLNYNVDDYKKYLENHHHCPVNIYVTDKEYTEYEKI